MISEWIEQLEQFLAESSLASIPLLVEFLVSALEVLTGPITGDGTRYHWIFVLGSLGVAGVVYVFRAGRASELGAKDFVRFCFPKAIFNNPSTFLDIKLIFFNNFITPFINIFWRFNSAFFVGFLIAALTWAFGPSPQYFAWSTTAVVVYTLLFTMADDFGFYVFHLAAHRIRWLWAFHKVHHSAEVLTPLTALRAHPIELIITPPFRAIMASLIIAPAIFFFTEPPTVMQVFGISIASAIFGSFGALLGHSHIWVSWGPILERVVRSPAQHQIHHSTAPEHIDKNLGGMLTLWDWIFGTLYLTGERETLTFGLGANVKQPHTGLIMAYLEPFWELVPGRRKLISMLFASQAIQRE